MDGRAIQEARGHTSKSGYYAHESDLVVTEFGLLAFGRAGNPQLATLDDIVETMGALADVALTVEDSVLKRARRLQVEHEATIQRACAATGLDRDTWLRQVREGRWRSPTSPSC